MVTITVTTSTALTLAKMLHVKVPMLMEDRVTLFVEGNRILIPTQTYNYEERPFPFWSTWEMCQGMHSLLYEAYRKDDPQLWVDNQPEGCSDSVDRVKGWFDWSRSLEGPDHIARIQDCWWSSDVGKLATWCSRQWAEFTNRPFVHEDPKPSHRFLKEVVRSVDAWDLTTGKVVNETYSQIVESDPIEGDDFIRSLLNCKDFRAFNENIQKTYHTNFYCFRDAINPLKYSIKGTIEEVIQKAV